MKQLLMLMLVVLVSAAPSWAQVQAGPEELAVWNSATFRRQFAESFLSETDLEPTVSGTERKLMQEAMDLMAGDKMEDAMTLLVRSQTKTVSAVVDFTIGNIHFQAERLMDAAAAYRAAVDKHPKFRRAWRNLGVIHIRLSQFPEALKAMSRVIELGGGDAVTFGLLGFAAANLEQHVAAESAYRMASLLDPDALDWKMGLARSLFRQKRFIDAAALCDILLAAQPDSASLWLLQANAFLGMDAPAKAAQNHELVDRLGQSTVESLSLLGDIYINQELFDLGVARHVKALKMQSAKNGERALRAASSLTARGALYEARTLLTALEGTAELQSNEPFRLNLLKLKARIAVAEGAGEEEAKVLEQIVQLDPLDGEALLLLGQNCRRAGDLQKAVLYFERAAQLEAFEADAKVRHAQVLVSEGRYVEALPLLRRAQALKPRDSIQAYLQQVERVALGR